MMSSFPAALKARPLAPYIGGKRNLARRLVDRIEATPHNTYAEPFVGMGGVFLRRRTQRPCEIVNDWSQDVSTFYRILQRHHVAFLEMLRFQITSRAEFERLCQVDPKTLTDLERAARFLYLQRTAFGGKVVGRNFGVSRGRPGRFDVTKIAGELQDLHERLAGVIIERLPFSDFIDRYDTAETLFYLDPPYWGCEDDYGAGVFGRGDFARLAEQLGGLRGSFILSINDRPEIRELFSRFHVEPVELVYTLSKGVTDAKELIISDR